MTEAPPADATDIARLPITGTIHQGYRKAGRCFINCAALAAFWAAVIAITSYGLEALIHARRGALAHYTLWTAAGYEGVQFIPYAEVLLGASAMAVIVYRKVILNEPRGWDTFWRIGRREIRVFTFAFGLYAPVHCARIALRIALNFHLAPVFLQRLVAAIGDPHLRILIISIAWHFIVSFAVTPFFGLVYALAAIDSPSGIFRGSIELSSGYRIRLATLGFVAPLPFVLVSFLPSIGATNTVFGIVILRSAVGDFFGLLGSAFSVGVIATAFLRIAAHRYTTTYRVFD
jgi:hypothetical protein